MFWRSEFFVRFSLQRNTKHLQDLEDACSHFFTVTLFKIIFTHMLYEEDKNSNTFNHLGFCVIIKHIQIGLTVDSSEIHNIYLKLNDNGLFSQLWEYMFTGEGFLWSLGGSRQKQNSFLFGSFLTYLVVSFGRQ